ncbi:MAG: putative endonuclease [Cyclobacteriaceae bacterium]|jgi:putative endonuclease
MNNFFVYILTNPKKTVLYTGMTNDLEYRIIEHYLNRGKPKTFAGRFYCYNLIYYESHVKALHAIDREKEIKDWRREKKEELINSFNPEWKFLNNEITLWPPHPDVTGRNK